MIVKTLLDSEIEKRGIKVEEEDIKAEMKSVIDKVGSKEELNKILKQRNVSNSEFTEDLKTIINLIVSSILFYTFHLQATTNLYIILHFLT